MSYFVVQGSTGKWTLKVPPFFDEGEMLLAARAISFPTTMEIQ
jgi:hypothetical protein